MLERMHATEPNVELVRIEPLQYFSKSFGHLPALVQRVGTRSERQSHNDNQGAGTGYEKQSRVVLHDRPVGDIRNLVEAFTYDQPWRLPYQQGIQEQHPGSDR